MLTVLAITLLESVMLSLELIATVSFKEWIFSEALLLSGTRLLELGCLFALILGRLCAL